MSKQIKQIIIIRKDLKMRRGKEIAQGAHASQAFLYEYYRTGRQDKLTDWWMEQGQTKICLRVESEKELLEVYQAALDAGLKSHIITDAGRTDAGSGKGNPTKTCIAIGPNYADEIDEITGPEGSYPCKLY